MNKKIEVSVDFEIEVIQTSRPIPDELYDEFEEWLIDQATEYGLGTGVEYFSYSDEREDDIKVHFFVGVK